MRDNTQFNSMAIVKGPLTYTLGRRMDTATTPVWPIYVLDHKTWTARLLGLVSKTGSGVYYYGFAGKPGEFYDVDGDARILPGMGALFASAEDAFQAAIAVKLPEPEPEKPEPFVVQTAADRYTVGTPFADGDRPIYRHYHTPALAGYVVEIDGRYAVRLIDPFGAVGYFVDEAGSRCPRDEAVTYASPRDAVFTTFSPRGA